MVAFAINNSQLVQPIVRESISRGVQGINQALANAPLPTVALVGGIAGGIQSGNIEGALQGAAGAVFGSISGQLAGAAGALQGISNPAAFVENLGFVSPATLAAGNIPAIAGIRVPGGNFGAPTGSSSVTNTYAGGTNAANPAEVRTEIQDATTNTVDYIKDSFLQGLQGGLSSIAGSALGGILGKLPGVMGNLLSSTGLSGALGSALGAIDGAIGNALGAVSGALGDMAGKLAGGLGAAISGIPGVGPVFDQFSRGVGDFTKNLSGALNSLPPDLQKVLGGAAAQVGANLVGKIFNKPRVTSKAGKQIANDIIFNDNPVGQLNNMASLAKQIDKKTFKTTNDPTFANMATACKRCAKKFGTKLVKKNNGYGISIATTSNQANVKVIENGKLYSVQERREQFEESSSPTLEYNRAYILSLDAEEQRQIQTNADISPTLKTAILQLSTEEQVSLVKGKVPSTLRTSMQAAQAEKLNINRESEPVVTPALQEAVFRATTGESIRLRNRSFLSSTQVEETIRRQEPPIDPGLQGFSVPFELPPAPAGKQWRPSSVALRSGRRNLTIHDYYLVPATPNSSSTAVFTVSSSVIQRQSIRSR